MNDVEFPEEQSFMDSSRQAKGGQPPRQSGLFGLVIRTGLAKDETGALVILSAAGILAFALAGIILFLALS